MTASVATSDSAATPPKKSLRDRLFRPASLMILCSLIAIPVLGPWAMKQIPDLQARPEYRLPFDQIQLTPPLPKVVPANFLEQVQLRGQFENELTVLDADLPRRLAEAFANHPWVEKVVSVRNSYPATVEVTLQYRSPVALIQMPQGFYAVDAKGVLLPPPDFGPETMSQYLPIRGIQSRPSGPAGRAWSDPAVQGAAKLAALLEGRWKFLGLAAIDVPNATAKTKEELRFELLTKGGSRILWGRVPGTSHPGELADRQKLGRLEKYITEFGSFDEPNGPYEIDIRHWQEISRRPLGNPHSNTARGPDRGTSR